MPIRLSPALPAVIAAADRPLIGMWVVSASPVIAEIAAGSGLDLLLIDGEHSANTLTSIQLQLQVAATYSIVPQVRVPVGEAPTVKQFLDLGAQNLIVPMVHTPEQAAEVVTFMHYPPRGVRGVGSSLSRSARWNRVDGYLEHAAESVSLTVQIESATAVVNAEAILAVEGVDAVFVGPSDLAATMGVIGEQNHPDVVSAVESVIAAGKAAGKPVGVNAFAPAMAERYLATGAAFVYVGADVSLLARASESLADRFINRGGADRRSR